MAIPDLDGDGFLPPGVHDASLDEIRETFGRFQGTDRRVQLQKALAAFATEAQATGLVAAITVDGSFTTGKASPGDVDLIVVLRADVQLGGELRPDQYNVLSARRAKHRHSFDVRVATAAPETLQPWVDFFGQVRDRPGLCKGMVRVTL